MIDLNTLNFGDNIYHIVDNLHTFSRKKIFKTDEEGVEWYRYDKPIRTFSIQTLAYVGRSESLVSGRVIPEDIDETKYFIEYEESKEMTYIDDSDIDNNWFASKEAAEAEVSRRADEQSKIDRG